MWLFAFLARWLIGIAWHGDRYRSPAARAFGELAREVCARVEAEQAGGTAAAAA